MREALSGLTVRGRAFLAAGITAVVCAVLLGQPTLTRVGVLVAALPLLTALTLGPQPLPARARAQRRPADRDRRAAGDGAAADDQRGSDAVRRADARGPRPLRARHPAAVRARRHRARLAPPRDVPSAVRRARALRDRPDERAGQRPVRPGRAGPVVPQHRVAHRHPAHRRPCRRSRSAGPGPARATTGRARSPSAAPRTSPCASTAAATTCDGSTGAARPGWAS